MPLATMKSAMIEASPPRDSQLRGGIASSVVVSLCGWVRAASDDIIATKIVTGFSCQRQKRGEYLRPSPSIVV